jgi:hypothetical protein
LRLRPTAFSARPTLVTTTCGIAVFTSEARLMMRALKSSDLSFQARYSGVDGMQCPPRPGPG